MDNNTRGVFETCPKTVGTLYLLHELKPRRVFETCPMGTAWLCPHTLSRRARQPLPVNPARPESEWIPHHDQRVLMPLQKALMCLALNIYHEARGEPLDGQIAVAMVTMNRATWQSANICQVVYERKQFSWTHRENDHTPQEPAAWTRAKRVASRVIAGHHEDMTNGATHFHAREVQPGWRHSLKKTATIGQHIFYVPK